MLLTNNEALTKNFEILYKFNVSSTAKVSFVDKENKLKIKITLKQE